MAGNASLIAAKKAKQDEFYTRREDIEAELQHYKKFFEGKTVYCNCDDPEASEFWRFFVRVFRDWHLKKLVATHYDPNEKNYSYKLELAGDGKNKPTITQLPCNGDFRSAACIELLKEADIVCTNPPFSLIREYIAQLVTYRKNFVVMAPLNAVNYKEIFPLIKSGYIALGYKPIGQDTLFHVPAEYADYLVHHKRQGSGYKIVNGEVMGRANVIWLTDLDIKKRHISLDLRGTYYREKDYPHYYNYNAIDVSKVSDIPCDYYGEMGVPISFLASFNPEQFAIVDRGNDVPKTYTHESINGEWIVYRDKNDNVVWKTPYSVHERKAGNSLRLDDNGTPGKLPYDRIIVKLKHPEPRRYPG